MVSETLYTAARERAYLEKGKIGAMPSDKSDLLRAMISPAIFGVWSAHTP